MEQITYNNVVDKIIEKFPEYKSSAQYFEESMWDLPYVMLGNLCLMAFEDIDKKSDISLAERLVRWSDEIFNNPNSDEKVVNLFAIEVLENLVGSKTGAKLAKSFLHGKSNDILKITLTGFNTKEFLEEYSKK